MVLFQIAQGIILMRRSLSRLEVAPVSQRLTARDAAKPPLFPLDQSFLKLIGHYHQPGSMVTSSFRLMLAVSWVMATLFGTEAVALVLSNRLINALPAPDPVRQRQIDRGRLNSDVFRDQENRTETAKEEQLQARQALESHILTSSLTGGCAGGVD